MGVRWQDGEFGAQSRGNLALEPCAGLAHLALLAYKDP